MQIFHSLCAIMDVLGGNANCVNEERNIRYLQKTFSDVSVQDIFTVVLNRMPKIGEREEMLYADASEMVKDFFSIIQSDEFILNMPKKVCLEFPHAKRIFLFIFQKHQDQR